MSAADEIAAIESGISEIRVKLTQARSLKMAAERSVPKLKEVIDLAKDSNVFHANNLRHMRNVADIVDITEFSKVREHEANSSISHSQAVNDMNGKNGAIEALTNLIKALEESLATQIRRLDGFGHVLPFRRTE